MPEPQAPGGRSALRIFKRRASRRGFIVVVAAIGAIAASWWFVHWVSEQNRQQRFEANLVKIISLIAIPDDAEPSTKFDMVRRFIHGHSRHAADAAFQRVHGNGNLIAEGLIAHALGQNSEPVHLECSTRSNLMLAVLQRLGYQARIVYVFDTDANSSGKLQSHTFVDVFNPATQNWESQDSDYNIFWRSAPVGDRVSVFEMAEELSKIEPCDETKCGWDVVSDEGQASAKIRGLIDIVSTVDKSADQRVSRFTSRANPSQAFTFLDRSGTFCEIFAKLCTNVQGAGSAPGASSGPAD